MAVSFDHQMSKQPLKKRFPVAVPASENDMRECQIPAHDPGERGILLIPPHPGDNTLLNVC